ncbi:porin [Rhodoferax sp.]|uniref:porin n=1 Tax=Rhodoferax sp. TaxID=50421 RepID=UPI0025F0135B|nr:porin [Rhodoferax sp.]
MHNTHKLALLATVALTQMAFSPVAMAQSSIIYGRVDVGLQQVNNGTSSTRVDSGTYTSSRLGIRGDEDLGGGLSALYFMEIGFNADTGVAQGGNRLFNRGSYVGLSSKDAGTVTIGRQYTPIFWPFLFSDDTGPLRLHGYSPVQSVQRSNFFRVNSSALTTPVANGTLASASGGIYSVGITSAFENNLVVYKTPSFGGLTVTGAYGAPEGYTDGGRIYGANAEFRKGDLYLGGGWTQKQGLVASTGSYQKINESMVGAMYSVTSAINLWGNVHGWDVAAGAGSKVKGHDLMVGVSYKLPAGQLWANYAGKTVKECTDCNSQGFGVGYHHYMSKRTELYVSYGRVNNDANSANSLNGIAPLTAGTSVRGVAAGIAHQF